MVGFVFCLVRLGGDSERESLVSKTAAYIVFTAEKPERRVDSPSRVST
jgi:hypothetical protein